MKELYWLVVPKEVNLVIGGPLYGTKYSLSTACEVCGTGAEPIGPRFVPRFRIPKAPIFSILGREVLVNLEIAHALRALGVECLAEVRHFKTGALLPLMEMRWEGVLPPFAEKTTGYKRELPCPKCQRDGFFMTLRGPLSLAYENLPTQYRDKAVLATFERFGNSRLRSPFKDSVFARPLHIIDGHVAELLTEKGEGGIRLEPVSARWA
jgi:hypothetical protein